MQQHQQQHSPLEFLNVLDSVEKSFYFGNQSLESQIAALNQQIDSLKSRLDTHKQKLESNSAEIGVLTLQNQQKEKENLSLTNEIRKIQIENSRLNGIKDYISTAFDRSPGYDESPIAELTPYLSAESKKAQSKTSTHYQKPVRTETKGKLHQRH